MSKPCRLFSVALALMAGAATVGAPTIGQATLLDFQLTVSGSAGNFPETFVATSTNGIATTTFSFSVTAPTQTTANPGDTLELDLLAPAGLQFVIATPAGALAHAVGFTVGTPGGAANPLVAEGPGSVTGKGGSGTISSPSSDNQLSSGSSGWVANGEFDITGTVSFTELSVQIVVPLGVTLPLTALTETAIDEVEGNASFTDPGDFVSLEAVPAAVPEPTSLVLLGTALAGLGLLRRRRGEPKRR